MSPLQTLLAIAGGIVVVGGAATVVWRATRLAIRTSRKISDLYDDWKGEPGRAGVPGRPGVMERLQRGEERQEATEQNVEKILAQLHPNGGGSLRDALDRVEAKVAQDGKPQPVQVNVGMPTPPTP